MLTAMTVREAGRQPPPFPSIFFKPNTTVTGHDVDVVIPKLCQNDQADYEGELVRFLSSLLRSLPARDRWKKDGIEPHASQCLVIGKDAKDVSEADALDYVAAYTCGNDISSRKLQRDAAFAGKVPQWGFSKGFDTYAPLGPVLVSSSLVPDPSKLHLKTIVDEEVRQDESVSDLLFDCKYLISYLSQGTTLQKGSVIMTGTPGGVGAGLSPPKYLVPGTVMEVRIEGIGTLRNGVEFA
jgi:2-keto-4-pentenoate hydratase/2-oxohepta-3-ene-1,7-dioic acid hydratase in catechol pathway